MVFVTTINKANATVDGGTHWANTNFPNALLKSFGGFRGM